MTITKCVKQAKFHMVYNELIKDFPYLKEWIDGIVWIISEVFATDKKRMRFGEEIRPTKWLKRKLGYLNSDDVMQVLATMRWSKNCKMVIGEALFDYVKRNK